MFTEDNAAALDGPDWLRRRRAAAAQMVADRDLPSTEEEVWRYSRISDLELDRWHLADPSTGSPARESIEVEDAAVLRARNGAFEAFEIPEALRSAGVTVALASQLDEEAAGLTPIDDDRSEDDLFTAMTEGFAPDVVVVTVPRGVDAPVPIVVHHHVDDAHGIVLPRLVVRVAEAASVRVLDHITSNGPALSIPLTDLDVERGGRLSYLHVQQLDASAWQIGNLRSTIAQEANLDAALVGLGGSYARLRTDLTLAGRGANGDLAAAYFGTGDQTLDFRTFQNHDAPDTTSNLLFKGAVGGRSRSVYTGLIRVAKEARGTNAFQTNRNVKLSDEAWAESVPNLEIETNDVRCSHASTVGPVDPEQHFYLESRGVPPAVADRLIVAGFFDEVLRALPVAAAGDPVRDAIAAKLDEVSEDLT